MTRFPIFAALLLVGCMFDSSSLSQPKSQRAAAARLTPRLESEPRGKPSHVKTLRLRVHVSREHAAESPRWREQLKERIDEANRLLEAALTARIEVQELRSWEPGSGDDLSKPLAELTATDAGEGCDFVVGLVASQPRLVFSFHELGMAKQLGKHFVLRSVNDARELEAIEQGFAALSPGERQRLYGARLTHKAATNLLHELAHALGAPHVAGSASILSRHYDSKITGFGAAVPFLRIALAHRTVAERDDRAMASALADELDRVPSAWVSEERDELRGRLRVFAGSAGLTGGARTPEEPSPEAAPSGLSTEHAARFVRAKARLDAGQAREAREIAAPLFDAYPDSTEVQDLRCSIAMRLGLDYAAVRTECRRLLELTPGSPKW